MLRLPGWSAAIHVRSRARPGAAPARLGEQFGHFHQLVAVHPRPLGRIFRRVVPHRLAQRIEGRDEPVAELAVFPATLQDHVDHAGEQADVLSRQRLKMDVGVARELGAAGIDDDLQLGASRAPWPRAPSPASGRRETAPQLGNPQCEI